MVGRVGKVRSVEISVGDPVGVEGKSSVPMVMVMDGESVDQSF